MDAFDLAKRYRDYTDRMWKGSEDARSSKDLFSSFDTWAREPGHADRNCEDLIALTGGDYTMALQTWTLVVAWFCQHPEDFAAIRASVTMPIEYSEWPIADLPHHLRMKLQGLPGILDPGEWGRRVFERQALPLD